MRYTYGTIAAMTCSILVLATFWPGAQPPMTPQSVAQNSGNSSSIELQLADPLPAKLKPAPVKLVENPFSGSRERIEAILAQPLGKQEVVELPFDILMQELGDQLGLKIFHDPLLSEYADPVGFVTLEFPDKTVSGKTLINYAIRSIGAHEDVGYTIRDNMVVITEKVETYETVIYNCNDLLHPSESTPPNLKPVIDTQSGSTGLMDIDGRSTLPAQFVGGLGQLNGSSVPPGNFMSHQQPEGQLIEVIVTTVSPQSWSDNGGDGAISAINGLIVIKHTNEVHEKVNDLLQKLRDARAE